MPPPESGIPPPGLLTWDNVVPWPPPRSARAPREEARATADASVPGGLVLWHRDRDGLPGDEEEDDEDDARGGREEEEAHDEDEDETAAAFELNAAWIERFAKTEIARRARDAERRRSAKRATRPKTRAALVAEAKVTETLAKRRAAERGEKRGGGGMDDADAMYGESGARDVAELEARLNATFDAIVDASRPPFWPCEPLR